MPPQATLAKRARYAKLAKPLSFKVLRQVVENTAGDAVQLVRTLPRHWLESHTVTVRSRTNPNVPSIVFKHLHESSCLLRTNLAPVLIVAQVLYMCCFQSRSDPPLRTCRSQSAFAPESQLGPVPTKTERLASKVGSRGLKSRRSRHNRLLHCFLLSEQFP